MDREDHSPVSPRRVGSFIWTSIKVLIATFAVIYVLSRTSIADLLALSDQIDFLPLVASLVAFMGSVWLSARRSWILLTKRILFRQALELTVVQKAAANFTFSSAGAVAYVAGLKTEHGVKVRTGIATFLVAKAGDLLAAGFALALSTVYVWSQVVVLRWVVLSLLGIGFAAVLVIILTLALREQALKALTYATRLTRLDRLSIISQSLDSISLLFLQERQGLRNYLLSSMGYSILLMAVLSSWTYFGLATFSIRIGLWPVAFIAAISQLIAIIPIYVFGGLGVYDITLLYILGLFSIAESTSAPVVVGLRVITLISYLLSLLYLPLASLRTRGRPRSG